MSKAQEKNFSDYRDRQCQIEKDVKRTDRSQRYFAGESNPHLSTLQDILMTYVMYNFDLGYAQGMSDLLAPLLVTMNDEVDAFWCNEYGFDEILKHVNQLSLAIDLKSILERAEAIYLQIKNAEELTDDIRNIMGYKPLHGDS